jgi:SAM-dependent methyltransferase
VDLRYEGLADWYDDVFFADWTEDHPSAVVLRDLLGPGEGLCLDVGCGTGRHAAAIEATGRTAIGLDIAADMLRAAQARNTRLVRADARSLPIGDERLPAVVATWLHTDLEGFASVLREIARVLESGGRFVYVGTHPCFVGHFAERREDGDVVIHPGYHESGWHLDSPHYREKGVRRRVGEYHLTLEELIGAVLGAGLRLERLAEPPTMGSVATWMLAFSASKR